MADLNQQTPDPDQQDVFDEHALLDHHNYDGIQEYDNPIPGWWKWLFIATIVFAPFYIMWFHAPGMDRDLLGQYDRAYAANLERQFGELGELEPTTETILRFTDDDPDNKKWLAVGKATFATNCVTCHGKNAEGLTGPNLTDEAYLNVDRVTDLADVINNGANAGAMPAWGNRLHPNAVVLTAAYLATLRGTDAPGGKPAEGDVPPPWGEAQ